MCLFSLELLTIITAAFAFSNDVALKPLGLWLHITSKTGQLKKEKRENEFCSIIRSWFALTFLYISLKEKELFENNFKSNKYG